jgi:hypothetical protein
VRKFMMSGLVASVALLGGAGAVFAGPVFAGTSASVKTQQVAATSGVRSAENAFLRAVTVSYRAGGPAARIAASVERLTAALPKAGGIVAVTAASGISCASPTACLAIGAHEAGTSTSGTVTPFAARLHAGTWKAVPVKAPKGAKVTILTGVSCKAATYCLVTGVSLGTSAFGFAPVALVWNGTALSPVPAPPMPAHTLGVITAVSCVAPGSCVVSGNGSSVNTGNVMQIVWTLHGKSWTRATVLATDPNIDTEFTGLRCLSVTSCVAVGSAMDMSSSTGSSTPVAEAWNGATFTDLAATVPAGVSDAGFNGVSCVSAHSCVAVGGGSASSSGLNSTGFAEVWNGKTWAVTKWSGPKGDTVADLVSVSCTSAVRCIAVGDHGTAKTVAPAALAWTGSRWSVLKVAGVGAGKAAVFASVSCPASGKCVTAGTTGKVNGSTGTPIAGYWNGSAWKYGPMLPAAAA